MSRQRIKKPTKRDFLARPIEQINVTSFDARPITDLYKGMRGSAGDLADAIEIYNNMLRDPNCTIFLTLAGSASAQGLMNVWPTLVENKMVDAVVATGASVVDMDIFEALGFRHYHGNPNVNNEKLGNLGIDRIFDTYIDESQLQKIDAFCEEVVAGLDPRPYAPWEVTREMGRILASGRAKKTNTLVQKCFENNVPLFSLGLTDSAFGMGSTYNNMVSAIKNRGKMTLDTTREYADMAKIKLVAPTTGLVMIGGGIPKNHVQDTVIVAQGVLATLRRQKQYDLLRQIGYEKKKQKDEVPLHAYAVQITVADPRDGACSSSTLQEARTWGKVDLSQERMVFSEATMSVPLLASAAYHERVWNGRPKRNYASRLAALKGDNDFLTSVA